MRRNYSQPSGSASYQRRYAGFRGVDFTSSPLYVDPTRSPYAENVIVDAAGVVHKRPHYKTVWVNPNEQQLHSLAFFRPSSKIYTGSSTITHEGKVLFLESWTLGMMPPLNDTESVMFQHGGNLYILDGKGYRVLFYDDEGLNPGWACKYVYEVATPTETQIAGYYYAEEETSIDENQNQQTSINYTWQFGEKGERNLLTGRRINTFCGDAIHKTFYLDCANFKVYKVEMYRYIPDQGDSTPGTDATVTIRAGSNIRSEHKYGDNIIAVTTAVETCVTTGKYKSSTGKYWYQIIWKDGRTAYVHEDRVSSYNGGSPATSISTDEKGWEEIPSNHATYPWSITEDSGKHCTKITFTGTPAPPVHPMGNGLPNIRVTGAMTEITELSHTYTEEEILYSGTSISLGQDSMMTSVMSVEKNGTTLDSSKYAVTLDGDHGAIISFNPEPTAGDTIKITYRRETFRDIDLIGKCNKYGCYGEYNHDRWWFTGNPDHLNRDWYTEPSDPTIVLENSYTDIGDQPTGIAGYLNFQSDMLIIKRDSNGDNLFRRTASSDGDMTIFPVRAYKGRGVTSDKAIANINGECVFLTPEGVYEFISSDLGSKYGTKEMSYTIKKKLLQEDLSEGVMGVWGDWLLLSFPTTGHCYVADTTQLTAPSTSGGNGWEWFYWTNCPFTHMLYNAEEKKLYAGIPGYKVVTMGGALEEGELEYADYPNKLTGEPVPYTALWTTPLDEMDEPARYKYLSRRGAMLQFDQAVSQMLEVAVVMDGETILLYRDEDMLRDYLNHSDYTLVDLKAATGVPYFTLNTPSGRWKYLQFIFRNSDPETDGIALMCLEFQYRFGRYII